MKMKQLVEQTGVPKQTVHHYLRSGLLPKPKRTGSNSAEYTDEHARRILLIKNLQENYFLPLSVIKKILKKYRGDPGQRAVIDMRVDYFRPLDQILAGEVVGEDEFLRVTGLRPEPLAKYEQWGIITPKRVDGEKVYSHDDQAIARMIAQYRHIGVTSEVGFEPEWIRDVVGPLRELVQDTGDRFFQRAAERMSSEDVADVSKLAAEITARLYYHLTNKLAREVREASLARLSVEEESGGDRS
jgi:DNA-binding transcriptional MerR regulator